MLRDAAELILKELNKLIEILKEKAIKYKYQPIIGRTHGTFAEPLTLGLKFALWYQECLRHRENIQKAKEQISYGKLSGAVGTYAYSPPIIEEEVCKELNLKPIDIASQVIPRELHAYYLSTLALLAASLERFAQEIRHLQRSEVKELSEPILVSGYTGSSAMPHKKNPVICERICGLSRLIRSYAATALENIPLWHERDISHSSVERIILPQVTSFVHYMINKFSLIMKNLEVNIHSIEKNMSLCRDLYFSGRLLLELIKRGLSRREAYYLVQSWCNQVESSKDSTLKEIIVKEGSRFSFKEEELAEIFSLSQFFRHIDHIFKKINLE
jgi:adenylosuccinate lyase